MTRDVIADSREMRRRIDWLTNPLIRFDIARQEEKPLETLHRRASSRSNNRRDIEEEKSRGGEGFVKARE